MPGELSLRKLLSTLTVRINPNVYVFITFPYGSERIDLIPISEIHMSFREDEGLTLIVEESIALKHGLGPNDYTFPCQQLTCEIHSSLEAVGFMAAMTRVLADKGIGCNPVSGYYHDHLFVPAEKVEDAVDVLEELARSSRS